jgi:hypothetical protein
MLYWSNFHIKFHQNFQAPLKVKCAGKHEDITSSIMQFLLCAKFLVTIWYNTIQDQIIIHPLWPATGWMVWGKNLGTKRFFSSTKCQRLALGPNQSLIQRVPGFLSQGSGGHGRMLTTHLHLALRLRMSRAISLIPHKVFMAWTRTTLPFCSITASGYSSNFWFPALTICTSQSKSKKIWK